MSSIVRNWREYSLDSVECWLTPRLFAISAAHPTSLPSQIARAGCECELRMRCRLQAPSALHHRARLSSVFALPSDSRERSPDWLREESRTPLEHSMYLPD